MDRGMVPILAAAMVEVIRRWKPSVILSIAHGYYFLAAALAARLTDTPLVLIVHDDWVAMSRSVRLFRHFTPMLFSWALHAARHIFAVCPEMQEHLNKQYGVESEIQYPATFANPFTGATRTQESEGRALRLAFAGCVYGNVRQSIDVLVSTLRHASLRMELHLYTQLSMVSVQALGWAA